MSVLIKNMEMPVSCIDCPFMVSRENDDCILQSSEANAAFENWYDMKLGCPLIEIPSADVRENVRGSWIKYNELVSDLCVCSSCERYFIDSGDEYDYNFCPRCGADMRGDNNE